MFVPAERNSGDLGNFTGNILNFGVDRNFSVNGFDVLSQCFCKGFRSIRIVYGRLIEGGKDGIFLDSSGFEKVFAEFLFGDLFHGGYKKGASGTVRASGKGQGVPFGFGVY